ncbi:MAG: asparagine synthase-related protein, partial [Acidimicrobiia bacterium]
MNLVFGAASADSYARARSWVTRRYGAPLRNVVSGPVWVGVLSGSLVGVATRAEVSLVLIGSILGPLDGFEGNPLDDADAVAQWLLDRFDEAPGDFAADLDGQFAICVITGTEIELIVDAAGMRTWYYDDRVDLFAFSTNLRVLAESRGDLNIDRSYEDFFLLSGYYPRGTTPYEHLMPMGSGSMLIYDPGGLQTRPIRRRVPSPAAVVGGADEHAVIDALYEVFLAALEQQTSTAPRAAVLLGGFDSALVAAGLARIGKVVETYSFAYADESYNQPFADELAAFLGVEHHWVRFDHEDIREGMETFTDVFNRPTNWPNYVIQTAELCKRMAGDGIAQCFSGDGCDSIFLGYPGTYRRARVISALDRLPRGFFSLMLRVLRRPRLERMLGHPYRVLLGVVRSRLRDEPARTYLSFRILDEISLPQLRRGAQPPQCATIEELATEVAAPYADLPRYRLAYQGKSAVSPNKNKMIGSADVSGITVWSPYMHSAVASVAKNLPEKLMRPSEHTGSSVTGKYILQRMASAKRLLPDEIIYQPKVAAVDAPIDQWYAGPLRPTVQGLWEHLPFEVDSSYVSSLIKPKWSERFFRRYVMIDKVITHA